MDDSPQRIGALGTTVTWDISQDNAIGKPFAGGSIVVDWAQQNLIDAAHYLLRLEGSAVIGRYDQGTHTMRVAARAPLGPPFDVVGRIIRLVRPLFAVGISAATRVR